MEIIFVADFQIDYNIVRQDNYTIFLMNKQNRGNYERLQAELEKKYKKREKKKKVKMKVSGGSVKKLQELIIKKTSK